MPHDESSPPKPPQHHPDSPSRRVVLGGVGGGLVAAPVLLSGVAAAQQQWQGQGQGGANLQNPRNEYPRPPFPQQHQQAPGLQQNMRPVPDSGENSYRGTGKLAGMKALITGGDSGIGRAAAIAFAREGADVAFNFLPVEWPDAREVVHYIRQAGRRAVPLPGDIRDEGFCQQLVGNAVQALGGLDILVNNAGHQVAQQQLEQLPTQQFDSTFKTNVYALYWITRAALPHLRPGSAIINTASIEAFHPSKWLFDYAATKAAIVSMTRTLAQQVAQRGIRVNAVAPGPFWTPLQVSGGVPAQRLTQFGASTPFGRPGQPAELAAVYVLLASPEASYSSGDVYAATGGQYL